MPRRDRPDWLILHAIMIATMVATLLLAAPPAHAATIIVTSLADPGGTCPDPTNCTLRAALDAAAAGDTIQFGVTGTIALSSTLTLSKNLTIQGPGAASLALDGQNAVRIFYVNGGVEATIAGLTIRHGRSTDGGGIANIGTLTVTSSALSGNSATNLDGGGGGIYNVGTLTITNSTLSGNSAPVRGGGIATWGTATITNSTLSGNAVTNLGAGGGIYNEGTLTVTSSTLSGNSATNRGGIYSFGSASLRNSIVAGNPNDNCVGVASQGNNLSDTASCFAANPAMGDVVSGSPGLGPLALYAPGTTMTHALLFGSPAIDGVTFNPTDCGTTIATDQRGVTRPQVGAGSRCDIGAFELGGPAPTISQVGDQTTPEDTPTGAIPFTVADYETAPASLTVTAITSNHVLVPNANVVLGGSGANRTATITPLPNQHGAVQITLTVSDGGLSASTTFTLTITPANDGPTIGAIADQTTPEDTPTAPIPFSVADDQTPPASLTVTATSGNQALVPNANILLTVGNGSRAIRLTPAANQSGATTIDVAASDGALTTHETFTLTVTAVNDPPVAAADSYSVGAMHTLIVPSAEGLLKNDTDVDRYSVIEAEIVSGPAHGTLTLNPDGNFTYVPHTGYAGTDSFTYQATDGNKTSSPATVTITVTAAQCAPRPRVVPTVGVGGGKLNVRVESTPLNGPGNNPLQRLVFDRLDNARVTLNGQQMTNGQTYTVPAGTVFVSFTVERVTPGQPTTVHFTVVDTCGEWKTFVGGGTGAGF